MHHGPALPPNLSRHMDTGASQPGGRVARIGAHPSGRRQRSRADFAKSLLTDLDTRFLRHRRKEALRLIEKTRGHRSAFYRRCDPAG